MKNLIEKWKPIVSKFNFNDDKIDGICNYCENHLLVDNKTMEQVNETLIPTSLFILSKLKLNNINFIIINNNLSTYDRNGFYTKRKNDEYDEYTDIYEYKADLEKAIQIQEMKKLESKINSILDLKPAIPFDLEIEDILFKVVIDDINNKIEELLKIYNSIDFIINKQFAHLISNMKIGNINELRITLGYKLIGKNYERI